MKKVFIFLLLFITVVSAQWSHNPSENTRVTGPALMPEMISDGAGGVYIIYQSSPGLLRQIRVQRLDKYGYTKFPEDGIPVSGEDKNQTYTVFVTEDKCSGIIVGFNDFYSINEEPYAYSFPCVQRIDSLGTKMWGENGLYLSSDTNSTIWGVCADGQGGAFVFYTTPESFHDNYYWAQLMLQHVDKSGKFLWGEKGRLLIPEYATDTMDPISVYDGSGGLVFMCVDQWVEKIYRMDKNGNFIWPQEVELPIYYNHLTTVDRNWLLILSCYRDFYDQKFYYSLRYQMVSMEGFLCQPDSGIIVADSLDYRIHKPSICINSIHNIIVAWRKYKEQFQKYLIYLQKVSFEGELLWDQPGINICTYDSDKLIHHSSLVPDNNNGAIVVWQDDRVYNGWEFGHRGALFSQRINENGNLMWPDSGVIITKSKADKGFRTVSDGSGGAIVCWSEIGADTRWGIFAQQISRNGNLGEVLKPSSVSTTYIKKINDYIFYPVYPNPFNNSVQIKYKIPKDDIVLIKIFNLSGKEVRELCNEKQSPGIHSVVWSGKDNYGKEVSSGIYFICLKSGRFLQTEKTILLK